MPTDDKLVHIAVRVPPQVASRLAAMANTARMQTGPYCSQLLLAAYSARVKPPTGDRDLDASVARAVILFAEKHDTAAIASAVGLTEATIVKVLDAWRDEVGLRRAAA